jgi:hypothetical protein
MLPLHHGPVDDREDPYVQAEPVAECLEVPATLFNSSVLIVMIPYISLVIFLVLCPDIRDKR